MKSLFRPARTVPWCGFHSCASWRTSKNILSYQRATHGPNSRVKATDVNYVERTITVNTCKYLYQAWHNRHGYQNAPMEGLDVPVKYVCTALDRTENNDMSKRPLVLFLSGAPGSYKDFSIAISFFLKNGIDVAALTWPDTAFSRQTNCWWHSSQEKTQLALDFLRAINIKKLDMIACHSSSSYVGLRLATSPELVGVKSIALFNPATHLRPRCVKPTWAIFGCGRLFQDPLTRDLSVFLMKSFTMLRRVKSNTDDMVQSIQSMMLADVNQYYRDLEVLSQMSTPTLVTISDNDKLMDFTQSVEMLRILGKTPDTFWCYGAEEQLLQNGIDSSVKVIRFTNGSHYSFVRHHNITNKAMLEVLGRTMC
ncbi:uncharacterized protein LOC135394141 isoform X2 [Ornithodoros turicata]|uniref:uncharacterized protein LOC135394141 isoform X2 n=1 Tax=Ornithodoros turicata TaxID=34597 RepID=UPI003138FE32